MGRETIVAALRGTDGATREYLRWQAERGSADCLTIRDRCRADGTPVPLSVSEGLQACETCLACLNELEGA